MEIDLFPIWVADADYCWRHLAEGERIQDFPYLDGGDGGVICRDDSAMEWAVRNNLIAPTNGS